MEWTPCPALHLIWQQIKCIKPEEKNARLRIKVERADSVPVFTFGCVATWVCVFNKLPEKMTIRCGENEGKSSGNSGFSVWSRELEVVAQHLLGFCSSHPGAPKGFSVSGIFSYMFKGERALFCHLKWNLRDKMGSLLQQHLSVHNSVQSSVCSRELWVASCQLQQLVFGCFSASFPRTGGLYNYSVSLPSLCLSAKQNLKVPLVGVQEKGGNERKGCSLGGMGGNWRHWRSSWGRQLKGSVDEFKGHGKELGTQTNGKELKAFLGMVLPRGCYMEVGQTWWVLGMLDANLSGKND